MDPLFSPLDLGPLRLANRFVRSATHDFLADGEGRVTGPQLELFRALARGGVGLIVTGNAAVRGDGRSLPGMLGLHDDGQVPGLARLAAAVRAEGQSRLVAQLNFVPPAAGDFAEEEAAPLAAAWAEAAARAREAGLDGVQLHAAHGYFLNRTLSPLANRREDGYGGTGERRARLLEEILERTRRLVGRDFALLLKLAAADGRPGGLVPEEALRIARRAQERGLDAVEVSGGLRPGMSMRRPLRVEDEGFFREEARAFRLALSIPVISVSGWRTAAAMREAVTSGAADLIALSRPLVREPDLVERFRRGAQERSACISCNQCLSRGLPLRCWQSAPAPAT